MKIKRSKLLKKKTVIGWREWVSFPELGINNIKAKIDTGARTSALHAFDIETFKSQQGKSKIRFKLNPVQSNKSYVLNCETDLVGRRYIKNSGGEVEYRYIIIAHLHMGYDVWPIELALTNRASMGFRLLLGRTAINKKFLINPNRSFLINNNTNIKFKG